MKNFNYSCGFTTAKCKAGILSITHNGNMGNSIDRSVNPNLELLGIETIQQLKTKYTVIKETGYPDYSYQIQLKVK